MSSEAVTPRRTTWSAEEDLALIRAFVHVQAERCERAGARRVLEESENELAEKWAHIGRLMNKPSITCRQRLNVLLKGQHWEPAVQILIDQVNQQDAVPLACAYIYALMLKMHVH